MIQQVIASDNDPLESIGGILYYRFGDVDPSTGKNFFNVLRKTGEIFVAKQLTTDAIADTVKVNVQTT